MRAGGFAAGTALIGTVRYRRKSRKAADIIPVHHGDDSCQTCMAAPDEQHTLSCPEVTWEVFDAWRSAALAEWAERERHDQRMRIVARVLLGAAAFAATALVCWLSLAPLAGGTR